MKIIRHPLAVAPSEYCGPDISYQGHQAICPYSKSDSTDAPGSYVASPPDTAANAHAPLLLAELWDHVIDHLWDDPSALRACSLTCWAWVPETRHHLFAKVLFLSKHKCLRFQDALEKSELVGTSIHEYVKSVVIVGIGLPLCRLGAFDNGNAMLLRDIFSRLRRVQSLDLNAVDIDASLPSQFADLDAELLPFSDLFPFPELRELRLSSVIFNSRNDIMRLLAVFPRLCRLTASELLWQGRGTNGTPLGPAERESVPRMLINLKALWISTSMRRSWSGQRIKRSFATADWATYVADYRRLVLQLLHDTAPTVEQLCITTADSLAEVDSRLYTCVRDVKLLFRNLDSRSHLPFSAAAPTFLSRLASRDLTVLTLCFQVSMTWTNTNWSLVDWPAIDDVLVRLHRQNTDFKVIFRITCVVGNQPTLLGRCASSADVAKGLTDFLPSATGTHVRVGVSAYSMTGPVFYISPSGELLDEHSI